MGVDISGMNPIIRSPKPEYPDWNTATKEERDTYFEVSDKWEKENPGDYFRSNWWGWRPIVMLVEFANDDYELGFDLIHWGSNDGAGLDNQEDCNKLADALEEIITTQTDLEEDVDTIYLNLGSWVSMDGKFLGDEINTPLNEQYPYGTILYGSVVMDDGSIVQPSHSAPLRHVKNFIAFLRECGGFEIW
jgi:hypothetical protein